MLPSYTFMLEIPHDHRDNQIILALMYCIHFDLLGSIVPAAPLLLKDEIPAESDPTKLRFKSLTTLDCRRYLQAGRATFGHPLQSMWV